MIKLLYGIGITIIVWGTLVAITVLIVLALGFILVMGIGMLW